MTQTQKIDEQKFCEFLYLFLGVQKFWKIKIKAKFIVYKFARKFMRLKFIKIDFIEMPHNHKQCKYCGD